VIRETLDDFMNRLFDGEVLPLIQHLIHGRGISDDEIQQLRAMLSELEGRNDETPRQ